jgi:tartrate dehydrogenase/decarboxylase/D-malate dehydrogenase
MEMKRFSIAVIPGDGVGQEVTPAAIQTLDASGLSFEFEHFDWGGDYYFRTGRMMPENALDLLRPKDAILLGAIGDPRIPDHITLNGLLLPIRRGFDQFANVRPAVLYPGVASPLARPGEIDMVVVRENTEGEYAQVGGFVYQNQPDEVAVQSECSHGAASIA